jgi:hypothetical protein
MAAGVGACERFLWLWPGEELFLGQIAHVRLQRSGYDCVDLGSVYFVRDVGQEDEHD